MIKVMLKIHVGQLIKKELELQERSITWFAAKLSYSRVNIYNIFLRENIDLVLLIRISKVLKHNFLKDIAELMEKDDFFS